MKKPYTLDMALVERSRGRGFPVPERLGWVTWSPSVVALVLFIARPTEIGLGVMLPTIVILAASGWLATRQYMECRWRDRIHDIVEWRVPISKREKAFKMFQNTTDGELAAWECHESHMPGDCPLCGAS